MPVAAPLASLPLPPAAADSVDEGVEDATAANAVTVARDTAVGVAVVFGAGRDDKSPEAAGADRGGMLCW